MARSGALIMWASLVVMTTTLAQHCTVVRSEEPGQGPGWWCVANPVARDWLLRKGIDLICKDPAIDCDIISRQSFCYQPGTLKAHASILLHLYYKVHGTCLPNVGTFVDIDPSYGSCIYPPKR